MYFRLLLLCFCLLSTSFLSAQKVGKRVKKRAKDRTEARANQRLDQKIDEGVDEAFNALEGLFGKKKKKTKAGEPTDRVADGGLRANDGEAYADEEEAHSAVMNALGLGGGDWEPYTNPQTFSLTMEMTERKKNGKEQQHLMHIGATTEQFAMKMNDEDDGRVHMILNTQDGKTTMLTTDKKGKTEGFRMRMPNLSAQVAEAQEDIADDITFTATGERKTIDGYDCEKIIMVDRKRNTTSESWVTQEIALTTMNVFGGMAGMAGAGRQAVQMPDHVPAAMTGFPLETTTTEGNTTTTMRMRNIRIGEQQIDRSLFDTGGAEIQEIGF
jgi:hypothetical protein